jgi:hypothetical protein
MTRVAKSDPRVAEAYCRANLEQVRLAWEGLRNEVERQIGGLGDGPNGSLESGMSGA